jgi:betaine-aldehyde dehydrogenase
MSSTTTSTETLAMFIGGQWSAADSGEVLESINPATEERLGVVASGGPSDVDRAVRAAAAAAQGWAALPWEQRSETLRELAARLRADVEELALIDVDDAGLPLKGMRSDVTGAADELEYFAGIAGELKGFTVPTAADVVAYSRREPYGVVGRIIPFNHPLKFAAGKIAAPLAAGNAVVLKPPEQAPLSALELARRSADLFPPGVLNVVTGMGPAVGGAIASHPGIPRVAFTGSVPTGRAVMRAAAEHIKHVTLELGGKNPMIICPDADPAATARAAVAGMNLPKTMGQSCQSNSRVFVHESLAQEFLDELLAEVAALKVGDPRDPTTDMGPLAFREHHERVLGHIANAKADGATLAAGGGRPAHLPTGFFVEPTVFTDVTPDMRLAQQEVFGPVLAVLTWSDEDELFEAVNGVEYGLTARIWTSDMGRAQRFVARVESGLVWVNGAGGKPAGIPFGGFKLSGLGKEGGLEELVSYTREKGVISAPPPTPARVQPARVPPLP